MRKVQKFLPKRVFEILSENLAETRSINVVKLTEKVVKLSENGSIVTLQKA